MSDDRRSASEGSSSTGGAGTSLQDATTGVSDAALDGLVRSLDGAMRACNRVLMRWLLEADVPLLSACVLLTIDPADAPLSAGEVAEMIGISVDDAVRALHELRSLGYAAEEKRRYRPTEAGMRLHASLGNARREALAAFLSGLDEDERRELAGALTHRPS